MHGPNEGRRNVRRRELKGRVVVILTAVAAQDEVDAEAAQGVDERAVGLERVLSRTVAALERPFERDRAGLASELKLHRRRTLAVDLRRREAGEIRDVERVAVVIPAIARVAEVHAAGTLAIGVGGPCAVNVAREGRSRQAGAQ